MSLTLPDPSLAHPKGIFYNRAMTCLSLTPFFFTREPHLMAIVIPAFSSPRSSPELSQRQGDEIPGRPQRS